jgi:hypothetical protein
LIDGLDSQCNDELGRCSSELSKDSAANTAEKEARDMDVKAIAAGQTDDLQTAVDTSRTDSKAANKALDKATAAHDKISKKHNANMDALATAEEIQRLNIPTFEADFAATKAIAEDVYDEEMEIITGRLPLQRSTWPRRRLTWTPLAAC